MASSAKGDGPASQPIQVTTSEGGKLTYDYTIRDSLS